jgi:gamma-glutamyltranspeptidase / glutathione hydrolase
MPQISPRTDTWAPADYAQLVADQNLVRTEAGHAQGKQGAVTVAYGGGAARAGLDALKSGGNAADAALTAAMMQIVLTGGAPVSFFGIQSLVYFEAKTRRVHCMNAEWNTVRGETNPVSIPGGFDLSGLDGLRGKGPASGRTALVGGFLKGVESAHRRLCRLPFKRLFEPSVDAAEHGVPVNRDLAGAYALRALDLARLPETRATLLKADATAYRAGETLRQPALAQTLRAVAQLGADHIYRGAWASKLVAAVQADGGYMSLDDLAAYDVIWSDPLIARLGQYELHTSPPPNDGGIAMIEAQRLAEASGLSSEPHWSASGHSLRKAVQVAEMLYLHYLPQEQIKALYPTIDMAPINRITEQHATALWTAMNEGVLPFACTPPRHSDDVVAMDGEGNIAAITHSSNTVLWGRTCINVDGISIPDSASFQQAVIARIRPGSRLPAPTQTGILFRDDEPVIGFASMGSGLHHRTMQVLLNITVGGMSIRDAVNMPDFFGCRRDPITGALTIQVPKGKFSIDVLKESGLPYIEIDSADARFGSEGIWIGIHRDAKTGMMDAVSHNRNNSGAFAF